MQKEIVLKFGKRVVLKGLKGEISAIEHKLNDLQNLNKYCKQIFGVEGSTSSSTLYSPFQFFQPKEGWDKALRNFIESLPPLLTLKIYIDKYKMEADRLFLEYIYVEDKSRTKEEDAAAQTKREEIEQKFVASLEEQEKKIGLAGEGEIKIRTDEMFLTVKAYRDNSHSMSDYFCPHYGCSKEYCLGVVTYGKRTEALARRFVDAIPELSKLIWTWHVEEYSMGHGTYLKSSVVGKLIGEKTYGGNADPPYWYEIHFNRYSKETQKSKYFVAGITAPNNDCPTDKDGEIIISKNEEKNGVEIRFSQKPSSATLSLLKHNGWRWSSFNSLWYNRYSEENMEFAKGLNK